MKVMLKDKQFLIHGLPGKCKDMRKIRKNKLSLHPPEKIEVSPGGGGGGDVNFGFYKV